MYTNVKQHCNCQSQDNFSTLNINLSLESCKLHEFHFLKKLNDFCLLYILSFVIVFSSFLFLGPSAKAVRTNFSTYELVHKAVLWKEAYDFCQAAGGHLFTLESKAESDALPLPSGEIWKSCFGNNASLGRI